ncbi:MAG TPA: TolC family protein [Planctomycetota bacterium]|nr:TolC family protein [Planctomycetota bacterium]
MTPSLGRLATLLLVLPALHGCASVPDDAGFSDVQALVADRMPQRVVWNRGGVEDGDAGNAVATLLSRELTADAAVQIALLRNAGLQATFEELGVAQADLVQAGLLANPFFEIELRVPSRPSRPLEVHLIEDFMSVFTRSLRRRVASAEFDAARSRVANAVIELAAKVRAAFYAAQAAEQMVELQRTVSTATDAAAEAAGRLREAGNVTELEYDNELVMDGEARLALVAAEAARIEQRERVTALLGLWGEDTQWTVAPRLPDLPAAEITPDGLETLAVERRLDLATAAREIEAAGAMLDITQATALVPSLELGAHAEREPDGGTTVGPSLGLPLPLFDQGQARQARDVSLLRQSQQRYLALAVEVRSEVRALRARMLAARTRAEYLQSAVLPLRERIVNETQLQYNAMQLGVFELLGARRAQVDAGRQSVEALREYWLARTELERAVGGSLPGVPAAAGTPPQVVPPLQPAAPAPAPAQTPQHHHGDKP